MFSDLRKEIGDMFGAMRHSEPVRKLTVAKPACAPARDIITAAFDKYGVKMFDYNEKIIITSPRAWARQMGVKLGESLDMAIEKPLPLATMATVTVSEKQAAWAEYLLLRTGKLYVHGRYVNKRNAAWAAKHCGKMPPAWADGKPWIERSCSEGMKAWEPLREAAKKRQERNAKQQ